MMNEPSLSLPDAMLTLCRFHALPARARVPLLYRMMTRAPRAVRARKRALFDELEEVLAPEFWSSTRSDDLLMEEVLDDVAEVLRAHGARRGRRGAEEQQLFSQRYVV